MICIGIQPGCNARARIDRIGSAFDTVTINNLFPDEGLERLLRLVESLSQKIAQIDATGFLDASVLGEMVHPRNFNTLRRIRDEDGTVIQEQEDIVELASSESMLQQLKALLASGAQERLESLPDGIHSGLYRAGYCGLSSTSQYPIQKTPIFASTSGDITMYRLKKSRIIVSQLPIL